MNENKKVCTSPLATRPVLYTDTIQGGKQAMRDDLWAVTTDELNALELAKPVAAAARPSGDLSESEITSLANLADRIEEADERPMVIARSAARVIDKLLAIHLASQSQAAQPSDTAEATIEWAQVYYRNADSFTLRDLGIAQAAWAEATRRAHLAGQSQATRAVPDLHNAIMNLPAVMPNSCEAHDLMLAYKIGHRDARHAAAELVNEARAAQEVTKQAAPDRRALLSAAINCGHSIDENKIVLHRDKRKEGNALSQLGDRLNEACASLVSVTHQAAKAETAEQAKGDQANVLPPTRGTEKGSA